jgi:hypothetical protein
MSRQNSPIYISPRRAGFAALGLALIAGTSVTGAPPAPQRSNAHALAGYEIIKLGRGDFNRLDFAATVDGVKGLLILDTGASHSALITGKYDFLLKSGVPRPPNVPAIAHFNETSAPVAMARDVQVGTIHVPNVPFTLVPRRDLYGGSNLIYNERQYDGLFGENFLRSFNAVVDCGRLALYLNTDPRRKADLHNALIQNGWTQIPMTNAGNNFAVLCSLAGHSFRLVVDTGLPFTRLDSAFVRKAQIEQQIIPITGGTIGYRPVEEFLLKADSLQIGSYVATNVHMTSSEETQRPLDLVKSSPDEAPLIGLLGGDILAANAAMIDIGNHNLYLKHPGAGAAAAAH